MQTHWAINQSKNKYEQHYVLYCIYTSSVTIKIVSGSFTETQILTPKKAKVAKKNSLLTGRNLSRTSFTGEGDPPADGWEIIVQGEGLKEQTQQYPYK